MSDRLEELKIALKDRYEIERELGHGGLATVYLANDEKHQRQVAIKVLRPDLAAALGPDRFLREIRIAANLNHPHILGLFDSGEADGFLYYVMPFIEGQTLRDRIDKEGELPVNEAVRLIREVVDALAFAHSKGVVHRDIKPDNVMLTGGHAIVADFGVAKAVSEATGRDKLTTAGVALGTPAYMSPEQATADPHVDHRADIYAVGAMAYELLAGRTPFTGATPQSILAAHVTQQAEPISVHREQTAGALESVIMKCLAKKPADRWQTAGEILPHLETIGTSSGGLTPAATMPVTAVVPAPRKLFKPLVVGAAVILLASAAVFFGRSDPPASTTRSATADGRHPIAVLPFTTVQTDEESISFTSGIHDDIRTQLSKIRSLRVTARASVIGFEAGNRNITSIGELLGVQTILAGGVQRAGSNVRINLELIDVTTAEVIWGASYIRELSVENIFEIQSEIATAVSRELSAALTPDELAVIGTAPTTNEAAYAAYRRGQAFFRGVAINSEENLELADRFFSDAIRLDPNFALAVAQRSQLHSLSYWFAYDHTPQRIARAFDDATRALELQPALGEAHLAMGYYHYYANRDYSQALNEFGLAERQIPGNASLFEAKGFVYRRQGRWDEATEMFDAAQAINPADSASYLFTTAEVDGVRRDYDRALEHYERALVADPTRYTDWYFRAFVLIDAGRGVGGLREAFEQIPASVQRGVGVISRDFARFSLLMFTRDWATMLDEFEGESIMNLQEVWMPYALARGFAADQLGEDAVAAEGYREAERMARGALAENPDQYRTSLALAWSLSGLGRSDDARLLVQEVAQHMTFTRDALIADRAQLQAAAILAMNGDSDLAIERIEYILANDNPTSAHTIELDPRFDSIRDHPRYREVLGLDE
jgi:TolB-like protein